MIEKMPRIRRMLAIGAVMIVFPAIHGLSSASRAEEPASVFLEDLTWTELRDEIAGGKTTIIVPIGGTEQNGPAMALGKHNVRVKALSQKIALALGNAVVAPVIAYVPEGGIDPPSGHMRFPGTISITESTFEQVLESASRSFKSTGFKNVVFLGDHGGYQANDAHVADKLNREWRATDARAYAIRQYYDVTQHEFVETLKGLGFTPAEIGTHAGLDDTSLMLAVEPGLVRMDKLASGSKFSSADGVYGDPTRSTAKLGALGVDAIVEHTVAAITAAVARH
jgi:creatinine amidohydrolase